MVCYLFFIVMCPESNIVIEGEYLIIIKPYIGISGQ